MQSSRQLVELSDLERVIDRCGVQVSPNTPVVDVVALMSQTDCVLVVEGLQLLGIFTAPDAIELLTDGTDLSQLKIAEVMTQEVVTLKQSQALDLFTALSLFCQHQLSLLPIVNDAGQLAGIVTQRSLLQALQPLEQSVTEQSTHLTANYQELQTTIEELQVAEEELREQNEELASARLALEIERQRYQDLFEFAPDGYLVTDPMGKIQHANQVASTLLNIPQKLLVGKPFVLFLAKQDRANLTTQLMQSREIQDWEVNIQPRDGVTFPAAIAATSIHDWQGQRIGWRWLVRDITDRQQMEQNLQAAHDNLEQLVAERTAELSQANTRLQQEIRDRQQAQQQISFQANILAHVNDAVIAIDNEHCITYWNQAAENLYGFKADEILGRRSETLYQSRWLHPEDKQAAADALAATGAWRGENIHIKKSGEEIYVESSVSVLRDERGTVIGLLAVIRDISSRKQAEATLQEREAMLRALGDNLPNGFIYQVVRELDGSDRFYYISQGVERETGFKPEEILANTNLLRDLLVEEDRQQMNRLVEESMRNLSIFNIQVRERSPQGELRWLGLCAAPRRLEDGRTIWDGIRLDISDLILAQQKIAEQAALLDIAADAIFVQDLANQILFWNKSAEQVYGWQAEAVLGRNAQLLYRDPNCLIVALEMVIREGKWQGELNQVARDGREIVVASRWTLVRDEVGKPKSILAVNTDITEKKQLETQFFRVQRLENLGTLASGISHDLNNILTPILMIVQLLQLKSTNEEWGEMLKIVEVNAKRGADLVKQVVSFARGVEGNRQTVQVRSLLAEVVQVAQRTFPKSMAIATNIPSDLWTVNADTTQLHQVLMNLCINARDAMPNGGKLKISATNFDVDESYTRMNIEAKVGSYVVINIADTGCGISPRNLDRIFDPFFTTKEAGKGTGLGLSTAIGIVKSHGGFIAVSSQEGVGTKFQVYLPSSSSEENLSDAADDSELLSGRQELILVVDDEAAIDLVIETTLASHNYRVLTAKNGIEAIALYAQYKREIALVLIDMMMPEISGATAIQALRRMNPQVRIVAMSGMKSAVEVARSTNSGIQGFLAKPFTAQELLKTLRQLL